MANRIQDAFHLVEANESLKASTIQFLQSERQKRTGHTTYPARYRTIIAVCVMLFLITGINGYQFLQTPVSYVSIDINPSVELALNRFDRVVSAIAYNEDGESILAGLSVTGKKYTAAIDMIIESEAMSAYLTDQAELVFTVAANDGKKENQLRVGIANCAGGMKYGGQCFGGDIGMVTEAHEKGLSMGKYAAYLQLAEYDDTVTADDCRRMTMSEIRGLINRHKECGMDQETHGNRYRHGNHK